MNIALFQLIFLAFVKHSHGFGFMTQASYPEDCNRWLGRKWNVSSQSWMKTSSMVHQHDQTAIQNLGWKYIFPIQSGRKTSSTTIIDGRTHFVCWRLLYRWLGWTWNVSIQSGTKTNSTTITDGQDACIVLKSVMKTSSTANQTAISGCSGSNLFPFRLERRLSLPPLLMVRVHVVCWRLLNWWLGRG